jgi:uncharacterized membrane protein YcaP (DUF421 family)
MKAMEDTIHLLIGSDAETILWWQMSIRAVFIFLSALILIRFGPTRIFGKNTSFDIVLGVILGSILSRALTANARFFPTLAAAATLVLLHMLLAKLSYSSKAVGHTVKGVEIKLIEDGEILWDKMKKTSTTRHDLLEALRSKGTDPDVSKVKAAYLERSGKISVIT